MRLLYWTVLNDYKVTRENTCKVYFENNYSRYVDINIQTE